MTSLFPFLTKRPALGPAEAALPAIEPVGADVDIAPFRFQDPQYIAMALQALAAEGDLVTVYPAGGAAFLSGRVAGVQPQAGQFVVEVGAAQAPPPGPVLLVAMPLGIRLQCLASGQWVAGPGGALQLVAGLPGEIIHLQRRRFPRLDAPLGQPFRADFVLQGEAFTLGVDDVSIGGIGLRAHASEGSRLMPGQQLRRVRVELGQGNTLLVDLEVRSRRAFRSFLAGEQLHFGCRFMDLGPAASDGLRLVLSRLDAARARAAPPRVG
jgi:hypothetical protein